VSFICSSLEENGLRLENVTSFCADNAPVNFGGRQQTGKNNVFNRFQEKTSARLISVGCPAHILHNAAEKGVERLTADVETIVLKICSHFKSQTSRVQNLKQFCEQLEAQYTALPTHTPTRWTTLDNVLEKMIELWEPLKQHFHSLKCPPRILENFFNQTIDLLLWRFFTALYWFSRSRYYFYKAQVHFLNWLIYLNCSREPFWSVTVLSFMEQKQLKYWKELTKIVLRC